MKAACKLESQLATPVARSSLTLSNHCEGNKPVRDVGLNQAKHVDGGLVDLDENTVVDLAEAEELEHLAGLGADSVDTVINLVTRCSSKDANKATNPRMRTTKRTLASAGT